MQELSAQDAVHHWANILITKYGRPPQKAYDLAIHVVVAFNVYHCHRSKPNLLRTQRNLRHEINRDIGKAAEKLLRLYNWAAPRRGKINEATMKLRVAVQRAYQETPLGSWCFGLTDEHLRYSLGLPQWPCDECSFAKQPDPNCCCQLDSEPHAFELGSRLPYFSFSSQVSEADLDPSAYPDDCTRKKLLDTIIKAGDEIEKEERRGRPSKPNDKRLMMKLITAYERTFNEKFYFENTKAMSLFTEFLNWFDVPNFPLNSRAKRWEASKEEQLADEEDWCQE